MQPKIQYEPTTRVCTVFFSAVTGFGLNHILHPTYQRIIPYRWPCFILALLLFLRFLFGSANHLWFELVRPETDRSSAPHVLWDIFCLIAFGLSAIWICDSHGIRDFLWRILYSALLAIVIAVINLTRNSMRSLTIIWLMVNVVQLAGICLVLFVPSISMDLALRIGIGLFATLLFIDVRCQLSRVSAPQKLPGNAKINKAESKESGKVHLEFEALNATDFDILMKPSTDTAFTKMISPEIKPIYTCGLSGLTLKGEYHFKVVPRNSFGEGGASDQSTTKVA